MTTDTTPTIAVVTAPQISEVTLDANTVAMTIVIPRDLDYFRGHFPSLAVLPGVVQLDWALQYAKLYLDLAPAWARTLRIKFRRLIRPGDRLILTVTYRSARDEIEFTFAGDDGLRSSGRIGLARP